MEHRLDIPGMPLIVVLRRMLYRNPSSVVSHQWVVSSMWGPHVSLPQGDLQESVFYTAGLEERNDLGITIDGKQLLLEASLLMSIEEALICRVAAHDAGEVDIEFSIDEGYIIVYTNDREVYDDLRSWLAEDRIQRILNAGV